MAQAVERARNAFDRQAWGEAVELLAAADEDDLVVEDLERLAVAAFLVGADERSAAAWERAHHAALETGDAEGAVRLAVWLAVTLILRGDMARAGGWLARAGHLVEEGGAGETAPARLLLMGSLEARAAGDPARALALNDEGLAAARRHHDADLVAMHTVSRGQALLDLGRTAEGTACLDEAMVAVTTGEVSPIPSGIVYCAVIEACFSMLDVRRAAEWTDALNRWCDAQPDLVPYRGQCLVHRSQVLQLHGRWAEAASEADRARVRLADPPHPALGLACYQRAELHRLRGEPVEAEEAYREASRHGYDPTVGLALLRLDAGRTEAAAAAIRRALTETVGSDPRPRVLSAAVDILLAAGDLDGARAAAGELEAAAGASSAPVIEALAHHAAGAVLLAAGNATGALPRLRQAGARWRELEMPYELASSRALVARACAALGDTDTATLELDAARRGFEALEARSALAALASGRGGDGSGGAASPSAPPADLTGRECEVLRLVAAGLTNRQIGEKLVISEHTVARHLQNIFTKLGVSSRTAATAFAFEHDLA